MARFSVTYWIGVASETEARARALEIAVEQTVEIPRDIVPAGYIEDEILGQIESVYPCIDARGGFLADISFSDDDIGDDFPQLLNIVFGNSSIRTQTRVETMTLSPAISRLLTGPRFGILGMRERTGVKQGPILMSAIKPVGLSTTELAGLAHQFALGGMDYVKDDHGLANQKTSPFADRLKACTDAIGDANVKTGFATTYVPNITGPSDQLFERAFMAKEMGAGGVMLAPSIVGFDVSRALAANRDFDLPIVSHPTFGGTNVITPTAGFSHRFFYGILQRLMGVDAVIYPNFGGRFSFSRDECLAIVDGCTSDLGGLKPILPAPGGGMTFERVPEMRDAYGDTVMYLIGGALLRERSDLPAACRKLIDAVRSVR